MQGRVGQRVVGKLGERLGVVIEWSAEALIVDQGLLVQARRLVPVARVVSTEEECRLDLSLEEFSALPGPDSPVRYGGIKGDDMAASSAVKASEIFVCD